MDRGDQSTHKWRGDGGGGGGVERKYLTGSTVALYEMVKLIHLSFEVC